MKRAIIFESAEEFAFLYQGFVIGGSRQQTKTMSSVRLEAKILDKFEAISNPSLDSEGKSDLYPTGDPVRVYSEGELLLTQDELELIKKYFDEVPWNTRVSRDVVKLADKLEHAEERPDISPVTSIKR
jgi:hypothetical protein